MGTRFAGVRSALIVSASAGAPARVVELANAARNASSQGWRQATAVFFTVGATLLGLLACSSAPPVRSSAAPAQADVDAGVDAWERGDYATAYREWKPLAEQGDSNAQYNLGAWYYHIERNYANAAKWYREAGQRGHPLVQHDLGSLYVLGQGVPQSDAEAASWFQVAAEQGHPMAQYNLGASYYSGEGVPQDYAQAAALFRKAAMSDIAMAQQNLASMYVQGLGVEQNYGKQRSGFSVLPSKQLRRR